MHTPWSEWDHILKIDPDKSLVDGESFNDVCQTGTDAIEIGGTTGMTQENMQRVVDACSKYDVALYQEPSNPGVVIEHEGLDGYLVPIVLNAGDTFWITGAHKEWVRLDDINWPQTYTEAYIVLNEDAAVAEYTEADCDQTAEDVAAFATVAEKMLGQKIVYIEYSGRLGDPEIVAAAADACDDAQLFYGGGIHDYESAYMMGQHSDTIVVGNLLHEEGVAAVRETVKGVRDAKADQN
ncbi:MAG: phosphoglycerol geranylgeranyltransferase [Halobacteriaceae archaeon]